MRTLLTGAVPALLDVGAGVAWSSPALSEDNLVDAARRLGRRVVVEGDDVWHTLMPGRLDGGRGWDCLDGVDTDAIDTTTWLALHVALHDPDPAWDVYVAHLPGIDHAGHASGAASPDMARVMAEFDAHLSAVVDALVRGASAGPHSNSLLVVLGDHGMTPGGDHGGASETETATALFAVDVGGLAEARSSKGRRMEGGGGREEDGGSFITPESMSLIDVAPTLALLMGWPIPFSSIGRVRSALWALGERRRARDGQVASRDALAQALEVNARQVERYAAAAGWSGAWAVPAALPQALPAQRVAALHAFLDAAAAHARAQHQYGHGRMLAGLGVLALSLVGRLRAATAGVASLAALAATLLPVAAHGACIFSVGCLQAEGRALAILCFVLTAACGCAAVAAAPSPRTRRTIALAAAAALCCNAFAAAHYLPPVRTAGQAMHKVAAAGRGGGGRAGVVVTLLSPLVTCWAVAGPPCADMAFAWASHACVVAAWMTGTGFRAAAACLLSVSSPLACRPTHKKHHDGAAIASARRIAAALIAPAILVNGPAAAPALALLSSEAVALSVMVRAAPPPHPEAVGVAAFLASGRAFYAAGHFCEFAGLHWSAGGLGSPRWLNRAAIAVDALSPHVLAPIVLPILVAGNAEASARARRGFLLARTAALASATASAGIQRRHLLATGMFAPRLLFEAAFAAAACLGHAWSRVMTPS